MDWPDAVDSLADYVVRIATPRGSGTGFIVFASPATGLCAIATAAHVVDNAHYWEEPIRLEHHKSKRTALLRHANRAIFLNEPGDTAALVFHATEIPLPLKNLSLVPKDKHLRVGHEMGWVGFPVIAPSSICFFSGRVSAWLGDRRVYFVDGVAINGVSGGPAFHVLANSVTVIGVVSAYIPNRATGDVLPGLCAIRDVKQFQELAKRFQSLDEAKAQESAPVEGPPAPERESSAGT